MFIIERPEVEALGFDLDEEIAFYKDALRKHAFTEGVPAPTTHPVVEAIVKQHGGDYRIAEATVAPDGRNIWAEIDALSSQIRALDRKITNLILDMSTYRQALERQQEDQSRQVETARDRQQIEGRINTLENTNAELVILVKDAVGRAQKTADKLEFEATNRASRT